MWYEGAVSSWGYKGCAGLEKTTLAMHRHAAAWCSSISDVGLPRTGSNSC